jgi:SAM-dependent methyltransferase
MLREDVVAEVLDLCRRQQTGHPGDWRSGNVHPDSYASKVRAAEICRRLAKPGDVALEIGAEEPYRKEFERRGIKVVPLTLPDGEMHTMDFAAEFDGCIAMHVLEHSPFPMYVLRLIQRAVKPGGWMYFAVPYPGKWRHRYTAHFSVLHPDMWATVFTTLGIEIVAREVGRFPSRKKPVEERFLCRNAVA